MLVHPQLFRKRNKILELQKKINNILEKFGNINKEFVKTALDCILDQEDHLKFGKLMLRELGAFMISLLVSVFISSVAVSLLITKTIHYQSQVSITKA